MKTIIVKVYKVNPKDHWGYDLEMRVVVSDHPRFTPGYRWDWGFQDVTLAEGYTTVLLPAVEPLPGGPQIGLNPVVIG